MRFRGKSIRRKIVGLLLVPLVSLTSVWALATVVTGSDAKRLLDIAPLIEKVGIPAEHLAQTMQHERRQTMIYLADPRESDSLARLHTKASVTDRAASRLRNAMAVDAVGDKIRADSAANTRMTDVMSGLDGLDDIRRKAEQGTIDRKDAFAAYNELVDPCYDLLLALHAYALDELEIDQEGRAYIGNLRAREALAREDALFASALAAGSMTKDDVRTFSDRVADRKMLYSVNLPLLPVDERERYEKFWAGSDTADLRATEERVISAGTGAADTVNPERWQATASGVLEDLDRLGVESIGRYQERVEPFAARVVVLAAAVAVLGFLVVLVSVVVSFRIGRGLVRDLTRLRRDAHEVSGVRLPAVMRRLAAGEQVDVETEAPRLEYPQDETGQVGQALNTLQRAAVEAAVKQSDMRRGVSDVFVNLARRSQVLLHRQLSLLDTMERRTDDTDELADLFRLDHLTTRMRRHAEGLVILSGAAPSRQWRKPIQLMDVVRAAVAEVEDYERIEVRRLPRLAVSGPAVADLTHLVAELLENATVFSPPHTAVQVLGERVANGFTLEIHDRGLGMMPEALLDANLRLAETPEFELSDTDRLGLFVVSRLAQRQAGVRVSLQPSPYGGTTAVVFLPASLLTEKPTAALEGGPGEEEEQDRLDGPAGKLAALAQVPVPLAGGSSSQLGMPALDGPVELEAPIGALDGEEPEGLPFRARRRSVRQEGREGGRSTGTPLPAPEQHQQARDDSAGALEATRSEPLSPPRRRAPVLVSDHGRPVGNASRYFPVAGSGERADDPDEGAAEIRSGEPSENLTALPRRVRQASLAPQLKAEQEPRPEGNHRTADQEPEPERDAEEVRSRMASLQRGWQRGRADNGDETGTAGTAPGTTLEGDGR